jgi:hypothetical protein
VTGGAPWRRAAAALLLGEACAAWSGLPAAGAPGALLLTVAAVCVLAGAVRLVLPPAVADHSFLLAGGAARAVQGIAAGLRRGPWEEMAAVAFVALEAVGGHGPGHAGVLGAAATGYLFMVLRAESPLTAGWDRQARVLGAALALTAVTTGAALLPWQGPGPLSGWMEALAAVAAILAGALALPR